MAQYKGITKKKMKDGSYSIMVRFSHLGVIYPVKNFTKLFGCEKESQAKSKLDEIRLMLSAGKDPFRSSLHTINDIFEEKLRVNQHNGDWGPTTIRNYTYFFNKHIKPTIGKKKVEKVKYEDVKKILDSFGEKHNSSKNTLLDILKPIFREEFNKGILLENIMDKFFKKRYMSKKEPLSIRSKTKHEDIIRSLYTAIELYNSELALEKNVEIHKMFLYMIVLTAHRGGEIIQLEKKHCHLDERMIIAPKEITKTSEDYHYPIPDEVFEYIKNHKGGKLFPIPRGGTIDRIFRRLVVLAEIDTISHYNVTAHDTRKLMISIMVSKLGIDSSIADYCLEHKQSGVISHYLELNYDTKVEAYQQYWSYVRNENYKKKLKQITEEKPLVENTISVSTFDKLKELIDWVEKGHLTREEFESQKEKLLMN